MSFRLRDESGQFSTNGSAWSTSHAYRCTYAIWKQMRRRCIDEKHPYYRYYGARGIRVEWESFADFFADMGERPEGMTLDRIDNDGNYSNENCRWASRKEQARNKRTTVLVEFEGKKQPLAVLAERFGVCFGRVNQRLKRGWPIERALTAPRGINQYASTRNV